MNHPPPTVLLLADEPGDSDLHCVAQALNDAGVAVRPAAPGTLTVLSEAGALRLWLDGRPADPSLIIGWGQGGASAQMLILLNALEQAGRDVLNGFRPVFLAANPFGRSVLLHAAGLPHAPVITGLEPGEAVVLDGGAGHLPSFPLVGHPLAGPRWPRSGPEAHVPFDDERTFRLFLTSRAGGEHFYLRSQVERRRTTCHVVCVGGVPVLAAQATQEGPAWHEKHKELSPTAEAIATGAAGAMNALFTRVDLVEAPDGTLWVSDAVPCPRLDLELWHVDAADALFSALAAHVRARLTAMASSLRVKGAQG
ncbi:hypothetical protein AB0919_23680 [Streptomyces sp. NPDC046994]|uniref:hypothetical protein n=1 Tax=Streptomyces sp. NPDC046994 TaxID=3155735 RepID=UPI00345208A5